MIERHLPKPSLRGAEEHASPVIGEDYMKRHHDFSHTVLEHHEDGSATVHHIHKKHGHVHTAPKRDGDVKGSAGDHDQMIDHLMDNTSQPNPGEDKDESNQPMGAAGAAPAAPVTPGA
jgi:hypothetical protein